MSKLFHASSGIPRRDGMSEVVCGHCRSGLFYQLDDVAKYIFRLCQDLGGSFWRSSIQSPKPLLPVTGMLVCWTCEKLSRMRKLEGKPVRMPAIYDPATGESRHADSVGG